MKQYITARAGKLLEEIEKVPLTDQCDEVKLALILAAMRETSIEMFHKAAENSRKSIAKIQADALAESIQEVEDEIVAAEEAAGFEPKVEHKIKLKSSILRRVDNS